MAGKGPGRLVEKSIRMPRQGRVGTIAAALAAALGYWIWLESEAAGVPDGIVYSTGILSATQAPVATASAGEVVAVVAKPGDPVADGAPLLKLRGPDGEITVSTSRGGRVDSIGVAVGDRLEPGQIVARITSIADLRMIAPFPASVAVPVGAEARLRLQDHKATPIPAKVVSVTPPDGGTEVSATGTMTVTVEVTDTRSVALKAGQRGRVYLRIKEGAPWPAMVR